VRTGLLSTTALGGSTSTNALCGLGPIRDWPSGLLVCIGSTGHSVTSLKVGRRDGAQTGSPLHRPGTRCITPPTWGSAPQLAASANDRPCDGRVWPSSPALAKHSRRTVLPSPAGTGRDRATPTELRPRHRGNVVAAWLNPITAWSGAGLALGGLRSFCLPWGPTGTASLGVRSDR
jgi:hypothetical protein